MATSILALTATVPAGTPKTAPATVGLSLGSVMTEKIHWRVPPGPRGNLGWCLAMGGVQVVPSVTGEFIVADDEWDDIELSGLPDSGAWQLIGWNTGTYDHTVYLQFFTAPIQQSDILTGDPLAGFPLSDAQLATMWLTPPTSGGLLV